MPIRRTQRNGLRPEIHAQSLENISSFVRSALGDPEVIPLWFGEGDLPAPAFIGQAMTAAVEAGHVFYTHQNGVPQLRQALAHYHTGLHAKQVAQDRIPYCRLPIANCPTPYFTDTITRWLAGSTSSTHNVSPTFIGTFTCVSCSRALN